MTDRSPSAADPPTAGVAERRGTARFVLLFVLPAMIVALVAVWTLVNGKETLYLRDVSSVHLPMKWFQAEAMRDGYFPLLDPYRAGGQSHLGNPNTVALYPDNLLYLAAPTFWALNAHFWLHLLIAPFAFAWMARRWGLGRDAAWVGGIAWAASGFYLSTFNLYNVIAGVTLAPALVAATLDLAQARSGRRVAATALLWAGLLLAGDPIIAVISLAIAVSAVVVRYGVDRRILLSGAVAGLLGSVVAAPQVVEFLRILPLTYRGHWGYSAESAAAASWSPLTSGEWLVPLLFGRPDFDYWGQAFHGGQPPLFYSLFPGALALALLLASGRPVGRRGWWPWGLVIGGALIASGSHNPIVVALLDLPGAGLFRFPVKFWLAVALGAAMLCGVGWQRAFELGERRSLHRVVVALAVLYLVLWLAFTAAPVGLAEAVREAVPERHSDGFVRLEMTRWAGLCLLQLLLVTAALLLVRAARRNSRAAGAAWILLHLATQLFFLRPLLARDQVAFYLEPPPLAASVEEGAVAVHGQREGLFGNDLIPIHAYPDHRPLWLARQRHLELRPGTGSFWGIRFEYNISPEGLDSFFTRTTTQAIRQLPDLARLKVLEAAGVELLIVDRELEPEAAERVTPIAREPSFGGWIGTFRLERSVGEVRFAREIVRSPHLNGTLARVTDRRFDPHRTVVLPGEGAPQTGLGGSVRVVARGPESWTVEVDARDSGAVVFRRSFLPIYRATLDGEPIGISVADLDRIGVEVPSGRHRLRLEVDRRPFLVSLAAAAASLLLLLVGAIRWPRPRPASRLL